MKPTVGRIVHYTNLGDKDGKYPPETQAALITKAMFISGPTDDENSYDVTLHIFYPTGEFNMEHVPFTASPPERGHWNWPPRE